MSRVTIGKGLITTNRHCNHEGHEEHEVKKFEISISESFVFFVRSFENWGCSLAARRPGDLSQCHSEEHSDEESACYPFRGGAKT
jgi:hypothetical protein